MPTIEKTRQPNAPAPAFRPLDFSPTVNTPNLSQLQKLHEHHGEHVRPRNGLSPHSDGNFHEHDLEEPEDLDMNHEGRPHRKGNIAVLADLGRLERVVDAGGDLSPLEIDQLADIPAAKDLVDRFNNREPKDQFSLSPMKILLRSP